MTRVTDQKSTAGVDPTELARGVLAAVEDDPYESPTVTAARLVYRGRLEVDSLSVAMWTTLTRI